MRERGIPACSVGCVQLPFIHTARVARAVLPSVVLLMAVRSVFKALPTCLASVPVSLCTATAMSWFELTWLDKEVPVYWCLVSCGLKPEQSSLSTVPTHWAIRLLLFHNCPRRFETICSSLKRALCRVNHVPCQCTEPMTVTERALLPRTHTHHREPVSLDFPRFPRPLKCHLRYCMPRTEASALHR